MDINEAALRLRTIEEYSKHINFFRTLIPKLIEREEYDIVDSYNEQAVALLAQMSLLTLGKDSS